MTLQWTENAPYEYEADAGGYIITRGWKLPEVPCWHVFVTGPELGGGPGAVVVAAGIVRGQGQDGRHG